MIDNKTYANSYSEVLTILNNIEGGYEKIPLSVINNFKKNCNPDYIYQLDKNLPISEQKMLDTTKAILSVLFRNYWATNEQRKIILQHEKNERILIENEKIRRYGKTVFDAKPENNTKQSAEMIVYKENIISKIVNRIKRFFKM